MPPAAKEAAAQTADGSGGGSLQPDLAGVIADRQAGGGTEPVKRGRGRPRKVPGAAPAAGAPEPIPAAPAPEAVPFVPWTPEECGQVAGLGFSLFGQTRPFPQAWNLHKCKEGACQRDAAGSCAHDHAMKVGGRIAAVANKYNLGGRFKEEIQLAATIAFCVVSCGMAEQELVKAELARREASGTGKGV